MREEKGQALVEFIFILPVFLFLVLGAIDIGGVFYEKYELQNDLDYITDLYKDNKQDIISTYENEKKITFKALKNGNRIDLSVSKTVDGTTPVLKKMIGKRFVIEAKRTVYEK